jgi:hypothetical protein
LDFGRFGVELLSDELFELFDFLLFDAVGAVVVLDAHFIPVVFDFDVHAEPVLPSFGAGVGVKDDSKLGFIVLSVFGAEVELAQFGHDALAVGLDFGEVDGRGSEEAERRVVDFVLSHYVAYFWAAEPRGDVLFPRFGH